MPEFETLLYAERNKVAYVTLNRPHADNAFNRQMREDLHRLWRDVRADEDVNVVVVTGAGDRAFCSGLDRMEGIHGYVTPEGQPRTGVGHVGTKMQFDDPGDQICPKRNDCWKPVIAAVNGIACAGALHILGEVDIIIASDNATFFDPHVTYGMIASIESMHLYQKLPLGETIRLVLMGSHERMSAQRAYQMGMVSEVVPQAQLLERATWVAERIASVFPAVAQATLQAAWTAHDNNRREAMALSHVFVGLANDPEYIAYGQKLFESKERPDWQLR